MQRAALELEKLIMSKCHTEDLTIVDAKVTVVPEAFERAFQ